MKKIKLNYVENIKYEKKVDKVRAIVLNKEGKALLVKYAGLYMLPGGKIDKGETEEDALKREVLEESGIEIDIEKSQLFLELESYNTNYYDRKEKRNINRINNTKFYIVETDKDIDENKKQLTESEKIENQTIEFVNLSKIPYLVEKNHTINDKRQIFDKEILTALNEFKNFKSKENGEIIK